MSNYYLCDTCGKRQWHTGHGLWLCEAWKEQHRKLVRSDSQTPREVCKFYREKVVR